jgi:hypothetical protein
MLARPLFPELLGPPQRALRIVRLGRGNMRGAMGQHERDRPAGFDGEFADRGQILAAQGDRRAQNEHVGAGDHRQVAALQAPHPRNGCAIIEADDQLGAHGQRPAHADHEPHQLRRAVVARRHEVDHDRLAVLGLEGGLEDQGFGPVTPRHLRVAVARRNLPMAVVRLAQQRGETGARIEPRPAQPIDRAAIGHERGGLAVPDQRVVFDPRRQGAPPIFLVPAEERHLTKMSGRLPTPNRTTRSPPASSRH